MIQTKVFLHGQHNYSLITGPTGPLVCAFLSKFLYFINMYADTQPAMSTFTKYYMKSVTRDRTYGLLSKSMVCYT